jgi:hypothetical protein
MERSSASRPRVSIGLSCICTFWCIYLGRADYCVTIIGDKRVNKPVFLFRGLYLLSLVFRSVISIGLSGDCTDMPWLGFRRELSSRLSFDMMRATRVTLMSVFTYSRRVHNFALSVATISLGHLLCGGCFLHCYFFTRLRLERYFKIKWN